MSSPDNGIVCPRFCGETCHGARATTGRDHQGGQAAGHVLPRHMPATVCFRLTRLATIDSNVQIRQAAMKVEIREWNAVAAWRWDMPDDDVCGICRNPYDSTCSKCKFPGDECPLRMSHQLSMSTKLMRCSSRRVQSLLPHGKTLPRVDRATLTRTSIVSSRGSSRRARKRNVPCAVNVSAMKESVRSQ